MRRTAAFALVAPFLLLIAASASAASKGSAVPGIRSKQRLTILSVNDAGPRTAKPGEEIKKQIPDSITVIHLGPDHPPIVQTVFGTVPSTISGPPYMAMSGDGHYGFVSSRSADAQDAASNVLSVIDLATPDLKVLQTIQIPNANMTLMHPNGRQLLVPYETGLKVFEMRGASLELLKDNPTTFYLSSGIAMNPKGDRLVATGFKAKGTVRAAHIFSYREGTVEYMDEVKIEKGLPSWDGPFASRFTPDGRRIVIPNGWAGGNKGKLDAVFVAEMTLTPPTATEAVAQVCDGIEGVAVHPGGKFAVVSCLEGGPYSHLAVIDISSKPIRLMYHVEVENVPEGMEFAPDGTQLFVGLTAANRIAVYGVDGFALKRSPYVIRVGHKPCAMAIGPRFKAR